MGSRNHFFGKKHPESLKKKWSEMKRGDKSSLFGKDRTGKNNPRWIADRTLLKKRGDRLSVAYRNWRKEVYTRDGHKCRISNDDCKGRIEAHHILRWMDFPELRFDVNNGITVCQFHHPRQKDKEKSLITTFQEIIKNL